MLRYLGRYTRKGMLNESRLVQMNKHSVSFRYKDYQECNQKKVKTVSGEEFIRRYLSHVLPKGLMRIRHFGWLSNQSRYDIARTAKMVCYNWQGHSNGWTPDHRIVEGWWLL